MKRTVATLIVAFVLSACNDTPAPRTEVDAPQPAPAETAGDLQVVEIEVGAAGYSPDRIVLEAGVPARLVFTRTFDAPCIEYISIPAFGVEKTALPLDAQQVIEIVPTEEGEYTFVCGMNMQEGTLIVASS